MRRMIIVQALIAASAAGSLCAWPAAAAERPSGQAPLTQTIKADPAFDQWTIGGKATTAPAENPASWPLVMCPPPPTLKLQVANPPKDWLPTGVSVKSTLYHVMAAPQLLQCYYSLDGTQNPGFVLRRQVPLDVCVVNPDRMLAFRCRPGSLP